VSHPSGTTGRGGESTRAFRWGQSLALAALVLCVVATRASGAAAITSARGWGNSVVLPRGPLRPDGRWIKDATGRTIIIHGLELARKTPPYHAPLASFTWRDARNIEEWGFNAVRLGWFWKGLEPRRGQVDRRYLAEIQREGALLARHHIFTLLEAHQDGYSEAVGGTGFPDWATIGQGSGGGVPGGGLLGELSWQPFENLYANTDGIADAFAHAWTVMAAAFRHNSMMLGYDLINEPSAGSQSATCLGEPDGCPEFDRFTLQPFEDKLAAAIRSVDPSTTAFYEPNIFFDVGAPSGLGAPAPASGPSGFAFHDYCLVRFIAPRPDHESQAPGYAGCQSLDAKVFAHALASASAMGVPPLFDEFGDTQDLADTARTIRLADDNLTGWMYWSYKDWVDDPGGQGSGPLFDDSDDDGTLRQDKLAVLSQPYPIATAGLPLAERYDPADDTFTYTYAPNGRITAPTVIFTAPLHYPHGYTAAVTGARVVSAPDARYLLLSPVAYGTTVHVRLTPAADSSAAASGSVGATSCAAACSPVPAARNGRLAPLGTASGSCDDNADHPAVLSSPPLAAARGDVIAEVHLTGAAGEVTAPGGISVAYNDGDTAWVDLGAGRPGSAVHASVICRSGAASYTFTFARVPVLPAIFSGTSTHDINVSLANSRLAFQVPAPGRYLADIAVTQGTIEVGLRTHDNDTPPASTFSTAGTDDLGILGTGTVSLDVTALPADQAHWTISIHPAARGPA
jgi:endoglycosylceramidase